MHERSKTNQPCIPFIYVGVCAINQFQVNHIAIHYTLYSTCSAIINELNCTRYQFHYTKYNCLIIKVVSLHHIFFLDYLKQTYHSNCIKYQFRSLYQILNLLSPSLYLIKHSILHKTKLSKRTKSTNHTYCFIHIIKNPFIIT